MSDDDPGLGRAVLDLLLALSELEAEGREGRPDTAIGTRSDAHLSVDTGISVGSLDEFDGPRPDDSGPDGSRPDDPRPAVPDDASPGKDPDRDDFLVRRRETEEGVAVVADFSTRFDGDLAATVEEPADELTVREDGDVVGRVALDDGPWRVDDVRHNNGIVEVSLSRD